MLLLNLWNSNQGDMKRESFVSTIFIVFLQIEGNLLKKYQCTFLKRVPSIFRINIEIVLTKDYRFMSPWLLFRKFIFPSVFPLLLKWICRWLHLFAPLWTNFSDFLFRSVGSQEPALSVTPSLSQQGQNLN